MAVELKKYDFPQVLRSVFEVEDNCLRVKVVNGTPGGGGELEVLITHTEDSVRLGNGTDFLTSTYVGPKVGLDVAVINTPLPVDISGSFPSTLDVNVVSSVLPTGAATSALQTTGNSSLASIDSKLTSPITVQSNNLDIRDLTFATDKVDASGSSVSVSNFPSIQPVSGTVDLSASTLAALESVTVQNPGGASAVNIQDGGNSITVDGSVSITGSVAVTGPLTDSQLRATPVPISGTVTSNIGTTNGLALDATLTGGTQKSIVRGGAKGVTTSSDVTSTNVDANTQALDVSVKGTASVSVTSSALPTGAATSALQTTGNSSLSSIDGKVPANLTVTATRLLVDGSGVTQPISASSLPLPTGAATESTLSSLNTKVPSGLTVKAASTPAVATDQALVVAISPNNSINANITNSSIEISNDAGNPVPVNGTVTANIGTTNGLALDTSVNSLLKPASTLSAVTTLGSITNTVVIKADTAANQANSLKVDGSATTQPISASSLPLPTGASTSALQTTGNTSLNSIDSKTPALGQAVMASSSPVVIASNQSSIPVTATQSGTWSTRTQDGSGNNLTSQVNGSQQALDVGINVAGVQVDPRSPLPVTLTHSSVTATNASSVALASNASRKYLLIQNNSNQTIWLRFGAAAAAAAPSLQLTSGSAFTLENNIITTQSVNIIRGGAANATFTIVEGV